MSNLQKEAWIIRTATDEGFPDKYVFKTLANSEDESWEIYFKELIQKDIASQERTPSNPFPLYWGARNRAKMYGDTAVKIKLDELASEMLEGEK